MPQHIQSKSAVALLQEFVQCSRAAAAQQHRSILQWSYEQAMNSSTSLRFRATVAFLLDGIPHHAAGGWQASKKVAQKDAAERALRFFIGKCGEQLLQEGHEMRLPWQSASWSEVYMLEHFCSTVLACGGRRPQWTHHGQDLQWTAQVEVHILGVSHKFVGSAKSSKESACNDTARRVLWYLGCPGYEGAFAADARASSASGVRSLPRPPAHWLCTGEEEVEELKEAERRTAIMRVQNRLQQELARSVKPGQGVWEWKFESCTEDTSLPQLRRATVFVPALGKTFQGTWARTQQQAQVEASLLVEEYLNACSAPSSRRSASSGSGDGNEESAARALRWGDAGIDCRYSF